MPHRPADVVKDGTVVDSEKANQPHDKPKRPLKWSGNLSQSLAEVGLDSDLVDRLSSMSLSTVGDLLSIRPQAYDDHGPVHGAGTTEEEGVLCLSGRVVRTWVVLDANGESSRHLCLMGQRECALKPNRADATSR